MSDLPQELLGSALRMKWGYGFEGDEQAIQHLTEEAAGFTPEQYAEAYARAKALDDATRVLANDWHDQGGGPGEAFDQLPKRFPGFSPQDYWEVSNHNLNRAAK